MTKFKTDKIGNKMVVMKLPTSTSAKEEPGEPNWDLTEGSGTATKNARI